MVFSKTRLQSLNKDKKTNLLSFLFYLANAGRLAQRPMWVFRMVDTSFQPARCYINSYPKRQGYANRCA